MGLLVAPVSYCEKLALFIVDFSGKLPKYIAADPRLRSVHPSTTRESKWRYTMKKVNLRDLYPDVYKNDHFVEVTEDVLEAIRAAERAEALPMTGRCIVIRRTILWTTTTALKMRS